MIRTQTAPAIAPPWALELPPMDAWAKFVLFLLLGYSIVGRSFAYFGYPPAKIFIGDVTLFAFIFLRPRELFDRWIYALTRGGLLGPFGWTLLLSILYGVVEVIRGIMAGFSPLYALQNLVFNVYPLYLFLGLWVGARRPDLLLKWVQIFAWMLCIYGPLYLVYLHTLTITIPGSDAVPVFGQPGGGGFIILGLLCLDRKPSRFWLPMTVGGAMLLAAQVRAEWLSTGIALLVWGVLGRKLSRVGMIAAGLAVLLTLGFILDIDLPGPAERGGSVSSREIVARGLSAVSPEMAEEYTDSSLTGFYAATIQWRETWWRAIWEHSKENDALLAVGPGYGFTLEDLVPSLKGKGIRTPHNIFFYALGYSGWVGVVLFFSLQGACVMMLWRVYKLTGQPFGLACWASSLVSSFFGNVMETPFGAIPSYLMIGLIVGPYVAAVADPLRQRVSTSWRQVSSYAQEGA